MKNKINVWKRYGVYVVSAALLSAIPAASIVPGISVMAEENNEPRLTLKVAGSSEEEEETTEELAVETEMVTESDTEEPEEEMKSSDISYVSLDEAEDIGTIYEKVLPALVVVNDVSTKEVEGDFYPEEQEVTVESTGVIIGANEEELLIAASCDTISDGRNVSVHFGVDTYSDYFPVKVKGTDRTHGLTILAIRLEDIPEDIVEEMQILKIEEAAAKVGQDVVLVGKQADFGFGVTKGMISAILSEDDENADPKGTILIDAKIMDGCSGGLVMTETGAIVGFITGAVPSETADIMPVAIGTEKACEILERLSSKQTRDKMANEERGYIGASVVNVSDDAKMLYDMPEGAFVYEVTEGSAADKAGIKKGDIITEFDGEKVISSDDLIDKISYYSAGETVTLVVATANNGTYTTKEVDVTLQPGAGASAKEDADEEKADEEKADEKEKKESKEDETEVEELPDPDDLFGDEEDPSTFEEFFEQIPEEFWPYFQAPEEKKPHGSDGKFY